MVLLHQGLIIDNRLISSNLYQMDFLAPELAWQCKPGQFLHIRVSSHLDPLLRRPLSIYDVNKEDGCISLLYKKVGLGTDILTRAPKGAALDIMGPLGKGFGFPPVKDDILILGGGVGIAPLIYLARVLKEKGYGFTLLYAGATMAQLAALNKIEALGFDYLLATDDGSCGLQGLALDLLRERLDPKGIKYIYVCGPEAMMDGVITYARQYGIEGELSLEEHMACGVGACLGCARKLKENDETYVKVCKDGPVFRLKDIEPKSR